MRKLTLIMLLCIGLALTACGGGGGSSQGQDSQAQIAALQTQVADLQAQLAAAQAKSAQDEAGISTAVASLSALQTSLSQLAASGTASTAQKAVIKTAENQLLVLQALADSLTVTGQQLGVACTAAKASIASLTSQLKTANDKVASLTAQLSASQGSSGDLSEQLAAANAQITSLTGQLNTANAQVTTLNAQIATLTSANASLQAQLTTATSIIADRDATIVSLNSTIATLNATIANMVATPIIVSTNPVTAAVSTDITVTASFSVEQAGQTATFSATGGTLADTSVTIAGDGSASTTFSSATTGTFNIYAVQGLYAGGVVVSITATPATTYSISGTISMNGVGQSGVIVALTGAATNAAITDANGIYSFAGLQNGSYTVTPSKSGYGFTPASLSGTVSGADVTGQDFTGSVAIIYSCTTGNLSPLGRWCDNGNGTVRDMTTGLIWLKNANCPDLMKWDNANIWADALASPTCGLSDSSVAGSWRVPTKAELVGLITGTEYIRSSAMYKFSNVQTGCYWSSSTYADHTTSAWVVSPYDGFVSNFMKDFNNYYVWPVRGGQ